MELVKFDNVLAVDPGENCGIALFRDEKLALVHLIKSKDTEHLAKEFGEYISSLVYEGRIASIIEVPQIYKNSPVNPNRIATLAFLAGALFAKLTSVSALTRVVIPHEWKGTVPKEIHNKRILKKLDMEETAILGQCVSSIPPSLVNNVVDAIGLGLYLIQR